MKVADAIGLQLDWMVAKCEGITTFGPPEGRSEAVEFLIMYSDDPALHYSTDWSQGGPIIERMFHDGLEMRQGEPEAGNQRAWARLRDGKYYWHEKLPLVAAMRCYCCDKLGEFVDIPEELCQQENN